MNINKFLCTILVCMLLGSAYAQQSATTEKTQFEWALSNAQALTLTKAQSNALTAHNTLLKDSLQLIAQRKDTFFTFNPVRFSCIGIKSILSKSQLNKLAAIKYQSTATSLAMLKWQAAEGKQITGLFNKDTITAQLIKYYIQREALNDVWAYAKDSLTDANEKLVNNTPVNAMCINAGNLYWRAHMHGLIGKTLNQKNTLALSNMQQLQLIDAARALHTKLTTKSDTAKSFNKDAFEHRRLLKILSDTQYQQLLAIQLKPKAQQTANTFWDMAVQKKVAMVSKAEGLTALENYFTKKMVYAHLYKDDSLLLKQKIQVLQNAVNDTLKVLLTGKLFPGANMQSLAGIALKNDTALQLQAAQKKQLIQLAKQAKRNKTTDSSSTAQAAAKAQEIAQIRSVLTAQQLDVLLTIKNQQTAKSEAFYKWKAIEDNRLQFFLNKDTALAKLTAYYLAKKKMLDALSLTDTSYKAIKIALQQFQKNSDTTVLAMHYFDPYWEADMYGTIGDLIRNQYPELNITHTQTQLLLQQARLLKRVTQKNDSSFNRQQFVENALQASLNATQLQQLLYRKISAQALQKWQEAEKQKITGNWKKDTAVKYLNQYYTSLFQLRKQHKNDSAALQTAVRKLNTQTPDSLHVLLTGNPFYGADVNNKFIMAIRLKDSLLLQPKQIQSLLTNAKHIQRSKVLAAMYPDSLKPINVPVFESFNLPRILDTVQYAKLLFIKNNPNAQLQAKKDWQEMTERKITEGYNKDTTIQQIAKYYLLRSQTADLYAHEPETKTAILKGLETTQQPEALLILKNLRKGGSGKPSSGLYAW